MKHPVQAILSIHNFYQKPGGEDAVFTSEAALLSSRGHAVSVHESRNDQIRSGYATAFRVVWNPASYGRVRRLLQPRPAAIAHFHNTFPLVSPSAYYAATAGGAAVVQTLHNYRLICPGALLQRNGTPCEECIHRSSLVPAIAHGCYRDSRTATAAVAAMLAVHRTAGTYQQVVDSYIALSEFARRKFIEGGLPAERIAVKPNFVSPDPGAGNGEGGYALFVGRLAKEKGIETLAAAWHLLPAIPLRVAGDGPLHPTTWSGGATYLGAQPHAQVIALMRDAHVLVFPSTWYECCPMTILEALACGTPVIASNLGSIPEFVRHGYNGLLFRPGDAEDLARQVRWAFDHPEELRAMRANARREFEEKYTAERNYNLLMAIYEQAIANAQRRTGTRAAS